MAEGVGSQGPLERLTEKPRKGVCEVLKEGDNEDLEDEGRGDEEEEEDGNMYEHDEAETESIAIFSRLRFF